MGFAVAGGAEPDVLAGDASFGGEVVGEGGVVVGVGDPHGGAVGPEAAGEEAAHVGDVGCGVTGTGGEVEGVEAVVEAGVGDPHGGTVGPDTGDAGVGEFADVQVLGGVAGAGREVVGVDVEVGAVGDVDGGAVGPGALGHEQPDGGGGLLQADVAGGVAFAGGEGVGHKLVPAGVDDPEGRAVGGEAAGIAGLGGEIIDVEQGAAAAGSFGVLGDDERVLLRVAAVGGVHVDGDGRGARGGDGDLVAVGLVVRVGGRHAQRRRVISGAQLQRRLVHVVVDDALVFDHARFEGSRRLRRFEVQHLQRRVARKALMGRPGDRDRIDLRARVGRHADRHRVLPGLQSNLVSGRGRVAVRGGDRHRRRAIRRRRHGDGGDGAGHHRRVGVGRGSERRLEVHIAEAQGAQQGVGGHPVGKQFVVATVGDP